MATTKKTAVKPVRRSRSEVEREFAEVREQSESARESVMPKQEEQNRAREAEMRTAVETLTVDSIVQRLPALGLEVSRTLASLSDQLVEEVNRLSAAREAVALERKELDRLHKIDVALTAIDQLIQDYERKSQEQEEEIAGQRATWEEESRTVERERKEQEEALKKQRQREIDEYEYKKVLERKKAQDKYDEDQRVQERKNLEKQEALEKSWQQREAGIAEREADWQKLSKESEQFPARLQSETSRAASEAAKHAEAEFNQQMLLAKKDAESEKRLADLRIQTMEQGMAQQVAQIAALQKQLDEAKQQVQDIAVRAIEGASGARALGHINQIAMEQAKNRSPQG